jgi:hypothetical protein
MSWWEILNLQDQRNSCYCIVFVWSISEVGELRNRVTHGFVWKSLTIESWVGAQFAPYLHVTQIIYSSPPPFQSYPGTSRQDSFIDLEQETERDVDYLLMEI